MSTRGTKNDTGKADLALIPQVALEAAARAFEVGERKYGRYNFYLGMEASRLVAALLRHATSWNEGEENDPSDGQPHLGSVIACAAMLLQLQKLGTLIDDRYSAASDEGRVYEYSWMPLAAEGEEKEREFEAGDKVYCLFQHKEGHVIRVEDSGAFPVVVSFGRGEEETYTIEGSFTRNNPSTRNCLIPYEEYLHLLQQPRDEEGVA